MMTSDRSQWCRELAASVLESAGLHYSAELRTVSEDNQVVSAFLFMHISVCHVEGLTSRDISSHLDAWRPAEVWSDLVVSSISAFRRRGVDIPLSDNLHATWLSFVELARVLGALDDPGSAIDDLFSRAHLPHLQIDGFINRTLGRPPDLDAILRGVMRHQDLVHERRPSAGWHYRLEAPHLDEYRRAVLAIEDAHRSGGVSDALGVAGERVLRELTAWLTPIEFNAVFPDPESRVLLDEALEASRKIYIVPHFLKRGWGDVYPGDEEGKAPDWLYDYVTTGGARSDKYTTGTMHSWVLVSEGAWDFRRISRAAREVEQVGIVADDESVTLSLLLPEHSGDVDPLAIDYHYAYRDAESIRALTVMAATGYVRLEVYAIGVGRLDFVGARAVWLPEGLAQRVRDLTAQALSMARQDSVELAGLVLGRLSQESQAESRFRGSEIARHELLWNTSLLATRGAMSSVDRDALGGWCRTGCIRPGDRRVEGHASSWVCAGGGAGVSGVEPVGVSRTAAGWRGRRWWVRAGRFMR